MSNSKISGLFLMARKQLDFAFFLPHFVGASLLTFGKFIGEKKISCNSFTQLLLLNGSIEKNSIPYLLYHRLWKNRRSESMSHKKTDFFPPSNMYAEFSKVNGRLWSKTYSKIMKLGDYSSFLCLI